MNRETRRQATQGRAPGTRPRVRVEALEGRQLLSTFGDQGYSELNPSILQRSVEHSFPLVGRAHPIGQGPGIQTLTDSDGKVVTGRLPNGDEYSITVHGPGVAIVTDVTPNDGLLDSEIDTIQLVGTDLNRTYVTGQVKASARVISDGTVGFNRLLAEDGVASVILNGFILRATTQVPSGVPRIALLGGARTLQFTAIETFSDPVNGSPVDVIVGDPTTPSRVRPDIRIDRIFNTAFDPTVGPVAGIPQTTPTVRILVNGQIRNLELGSVSANPVTPINQAQLSPVSYTGRTSVQAFGVEGLKVAGAARNLTLSRGAQPFSGRFNGMNRVGHAYFGGNADAVAIDATSTEGGEGASGRGEIGRLKFLRGLGNPNNASGSLLEAGTPLGYRGYPAFGLSGGAVAAARGIGRAEFAPARLYRLFPSDPAAVGYAGNGRINYVRRPGEALTNATVTANNSIGATTVVGDARNSLIAAGFDAISYRQGLDPVRQPSRIGPYSQRGDLVDTVIASSWRPVDRVYGNRNDVAGRGAIAGRFLGNLYLSAGDDLTDTNAGPGPYRGVGFFARRLDGYLPSDGGPQAQRSKRIESVLYRV